MQGDKYRNKELDKPYMEFALNETNFVAIIRQNKIHIF